MTTNGDNFDSCYHSESDFSEHYKSSLPIKAKTSEPVSLLRFLCSDEQDQNKILSPR